MTIEDIRDKMAARFGVSVEEIMSSSRRGETSRARHIGMYLAREVGKMPFKKIGKCFNRHHATVICAHRSIRDQMKIYPEFKQEVERIIKEIS